MNLNSLKVYFQPNGSISKSSMFRLGLLQFLVFMFLWQFFGPTSFPTPTEIGNALANLWNKENLSYFLLTSVFWNVMVIVISTTVSLILAYSTVMPFMVPIVNLIAKIRFMGIAGWLYFFIIFAPNSEMAKLYLVLFGMIGFFVSSILNIVVKVTRDEKNYPRTLKMGEWRVVLNTTVRGKLPEVFDVVRDCAAMGLLVLVMVEASFKSQGGLGGLLENMRKVMHYDQVFAIQFVIMAYGMLQDSGIYGLKRWICPHAFIKLEGKK